MKIGKKLMTFLPFDSCEDLDNIHKFHYLRITSILKHRIIKLLEICFEETFETTNLLVYSHFKQLLNTESITSPSAQYLNIKKKIAKIYKYKIKNIFLN